MPMPKAMVATMTTPDMRHESVLIGITRLLAHAGVIGERGDAVLLEEGRHLFGLLARQAVDDAAASLMALDEIEQLPLAVLLGARRQA